MISKENLSDAEMDTLTKSCSPTIVITANGEVQTHEKATVYVKELNVFLTTKVLENTSAVLSLGKLCDENEYSYEWINGQKRDSDTLHYGELRSFCADPEDKEFKDTMKNARKKLETSVAPAMPCKILKQNCGSGGPPR